jgi:hypothetical protein
MDLTTRLCSIENSIILIGYMLYNGGSLHKNIREKNKIDTIVSTLMIQ